MNQITNFVRVLRVASLLQTRSLFGALMFATIAAFGSGIVSSPSEAALRAALSGGGDVTFNCDGIITLSAPLAITDDTSIVAKMNQITLNGNRAGRLFTVSANAKLELEGLTLANGLSDSGGAICNTGTVRALDCRFVGNLASNIMTLAYRGGAVYNAGAFTARQCTFARNIAATPINHGPEVYLSSGGAIFNAGTLALTECLLVENQTLGWYGVNGYNAFGGGSGGPGRAGGNALGGALCNEGAAQLVNCTVVSNSCTGGYGGYGGEGPYSMHNRDRIYYGPGGNGGNGGSGWGGGIYSTGYSINLTNCTITYNSATGGQGGDYGGGSPPGVSGTNGSVSGALHASGTANLINALLAANSPTNATGGLSDLGHNLSSDGSCDFLGPGSLENTDAKLGFLADHGGPTFTLPLLPGSPARDAADNAAAPATDQRGRPRPYGQTSDIGAYEVMPLLRVSRIAGGCEVILLDGQTNQACCLIWSVNLSAWQSVATNVIGADGRTTFQDTTPLDGDRRFYRVALP